MDLEELISGWNSLTEAEKQAFRDLQERQKVLPFPLKMYYNNIKSGYFMRRKFFPIIIFMAVILVGVAAYFFERNPWISLVSLVLGFVLGVLFIWEIESKG